MKMHRNGLQIDPAKCLCLGTINCTNAAVTVSGGIGVHDDEALGGGNGRYIVDSWDKWAEL